jgi:hypothetical protein
MGLSIRNLGVLLILTAIIPMGLSVTHYPIYIISPPSTLLTREINISTASNVSIMVSMQEGKNCTINNNLMSSTSQDYVFEKNMTFNHGSTTLLIKCTDEWSGTVTRQIIIKNDILGPSIVLVSPFGTVGASANLIVYSSDAVSCFANDSLMAQNNPQFFSKDLAGLSNGPNMFNVSCLDSFGNIAANQFIITADTLMPELIIISPKQNFSYNNNTILLNISANDSHLNSTWYNFNGTNITYNSEIDTDFGADGFKTLQVWADDSVGNINYVNVTFTVDTIAPDLEIISPLNVTYNNATQLVNISADDLNLDNVWFSNGTENITYTGEVLIDFMERSNTLQVWANDSAGNVNFSSVSFTVDTIAPSLEIITPINQIYDTTVPSLNILSDGINIWYNFNGTNITYNGEVEVDFGIDGIKTLQVWAIDSAGNLNYSSVTFHIFLGNDLVVQSLNLSSANDAIVDYKYDISSMIKNNGNRNAYVQVLYFDNGTQVCNDSFLINAGELIKSNASDLNFTKGIHNITVAAVVQNELNPFDNSLTSFLESKYAIEKMNIDFLAPDEVMPDSNVSITIFLYNPLSFDYLLDNIPHADFPTAFNPLDYSGINGIDLNSKSLVSFDYNFICPGTDGNYNFWANSLLQEEGIELPSKNNSLKVRLPASPILSASIIVMPKISNLYDSSVIANVYNYGNETAYYANATIILPSGVHLASGEEPTILLENITEGTYKDIIWTVRGDYSGDFAIGIKVQSQNYDDIEKDIPLDKPIIAQSIAYDNVIDESENLIVRVLLNNTGANALVNVSLILSEGLLSDKMFEEVSINNNTLNNETIFSISSGLVENKTFKILVTEAESGYYTESLITFSKIDNSAPEIEVLSPMNQSYNSNIIWFNATSNENIIQWIANYNGTTNITLDSINSSMFVEDGEWNLFLYATDSSGNLGLNNSINFTVDTTAPSLSIISPDDSIKNNASQLLNISSDGISVWYNWNGANVTYAFPINIAFNNGSNTVHAWAIDSAGNINQASVTFIVNSSMQVTPPVVAPPVIPPVIAIGHAVIPSIKIIAPQNISYNNSAQLLKISSNGASVWYNWNGTNYTYTSPVFINFKKGINTLQVWAKNSMGAMNYAAVSFNVNSNTQANNSAFADNSLIDFSILNEVDELLTYEQKLSFEIIKSNLIKDNYNSSGENYKISSYLLKKMNYSIFNESYLFTELSNGIRMNVNISALKVSIDNVNNTKYEITRMLTNALNSTIANLTIYFELPKDSIASPLVDFRDSKAYFTIDSLAPGESITLNYSFLTKSSSELAVGSFEIAHEEAASNPLTAFIVLAKNNKEITLYSLAGIIILSFAALAYIARDDLLKSLSFSGLKN